MSYLTKCFSSVVIALLFSFALSNPVDLNPSQDAAELMRIVRSPKRHHLFGGGHHGGYGGPHGGYGGPHGSYGGYGGPHGGYGGQHGSYGGPHGGNGGPHGGGGSFAGSAAFAGSNGHGSHGGPNQSQSASFAFGPFSASFSQSQAGGRGGDPGFFDY